LIPFAQILSCSSKARLLEIVGPAVDHTGVLKHHWAFNEALKTASTILYAVDRADVEGQNVETIREFFERLERNPDICERLQGKVRVSISGYDDDKRELWEIPEVLRWFELAEPVVKYWFYFLAIRSGGLQVLYACVCGPKRVRKMRLQPMIKVSLDKDKILAFMNRHFAWLNEMTDRMGMPIERNKEITFAVLDELGLPHGK
jgi:hypothetical protein